MPVEAGTSGGFRFVTQSVFDQLAADENLAPGTFYYTTNLIHLARTRTAYYTYGGASLGDIITELLQNQTFKQQLINALKQDNTLIENIANSVINNQTFFSNIANEIIQNETILNQIISDILNSETLIENIVNSIVSNEILVSNIVNEIISNETLIGDIVNQIITNETLYTNILEQVLINETFIINVANNIVNNETIVNNITQAVMADEDLYRQIAENFHSIPAGGTTGQALIKRSNADFDVRWQDLPTGGGSGGGNGNGGGGGISGFDGDINALVTLLLNTDEFKNYFSQFLTGDSIANIVSAISLVDPNGISIARNENGTLYVQQSRPDRYGIVKCGHNCYCHISTLNLALQSIDGLLVAEVNKNLGNGCNCGKSIDIIYPMAFPTRKPTDREELLGRLTFIDDDFTEDFVIDVVAKPCCPCGDGGGDGRPQTADGSGSGSGSDTDFVAEFEITVLGEHNPDNDFTLDFTANAYNTNTDYIKDFSCNVRSSDDFMKDFTANAYNPQKDYIKDFIANVSNTSKDYIKDFTANAYNDKKDYFKDFAVNAYNSQKDFIKDFTANAYNNKKDYFKDFTPRGIILGEYTKDFTPKVIKLGDYTKDFPVTVKSTAPYTKDFSVTVKGTKPYEKNFTVTVVPRNLLIVWVELNQYRAQNCYLSKMTGKFFITTSTSFWTDSDSKLTITNSLVQALNPTNTYHVTVYTDAAPSPKYYSLQSYVSGYKLTHIIIVEKRYMSSTGSYYVVTNTHYPISGDNPY